MPPELQQQLDDFIEKWGPPGKFRRLLLQQDLQALCEAFGALAIETFVEACKKRKGTT